jgi:hypothetical protein
MRRKRSGINVRNKRRCGRGKRKMRIGRRISRHKRKHKRRE